MNRRRFIFGQSLSISRIDLGLMALDRQRRKRWRRERTHQEMYMQLAEAMDSLQHICTEGCTDVGPRSSPPASNPCTSFSTCEGLQLLLRHAATCGDRKLTPKSCNRCKRLWQLFRLHSALCEDSVSCRVPLCRCAI